MSTQKKFPIQDRKIYVIISVNEFISFFPVGKVVSCPKYHSLNLSDLLGQHFVRLFSMGPV